MSPAPARTDAIEEASLLLSLAARPVIWAGGGAVAAKAWDELAEVAVLLGAPVVTSTSGKGALSDDQPLAVGSLFDTPEVARLIGDADAALAVGTSFSARSTRNGQLPIPLQLLHIDIDPAVIGARYPARSGIVRDAREALAALAGGLRARTGRTACDDRAGPVREAARARLGGAGSPPVAALEALRSAVPDAVPSVWDVAPARWAVPLFVVRTPGTFFAPGRGAAPGASLATNQGVAVASASEVLAGRDALTAPVVVAFPDALWAGSPRSGAPEPQDPDGSALEAATALAADAGMAAIQVGDPAGLASAVGEALATSRPTLIAVTARFA